MKLTTLEKASKAKAFEFVSRLKQGGSLSEKEIDLLLNFFFPDVKASKRTALQWVGAATNPKDLRPVCRYVHVDNGQAMASNGGLVSWCETVLENGIYDPKSLLPVIDSVSFPDIRRVIGDRVSPSLFVTYRLPNVPTKIIALPKNKNMKAVELGGLWFDLDFVQVAARGGQDLIGYVDVANRFIKGENFKLMANVNILQFNQIIAIPDDAVLYIVWNGGDYYGTIADLLGSNFNKILQWDGSSTVTVPAAYSGTLWNITRNKFSTYSIVGTVLTIDGATAETDDILQFTSN